MQFIISAVFSFSLKLLSRTERGKAGRGRHKHANFVSHTSPLKRILLSLFSAMSLSGMTKNVGTPLRMRSISATRSIGEMRSFPRMDSIRLRVTCPIGLNLQTQPSNSRRFIVHAGQQFESVVVGSMAGFDPLRRTISGATPRKSTRSKCPSASATLAETRTAPGRSTSAAPGKEKLPMLDDSGGSNGNDGFKPYYRGDDNGAGGGAGGGGSSPGKFPWGDFGFFFFMFLLHFLFTQVIGEGYFSFKQSDGSNKPIQHYL